MGSPEPAGRSPPAPAPASNEGEAETSSGSGSPAAVALPSSSPRSAGGTERPAGGLAKHQSARLSLTQATKALGKIELQIASGPQWTWIRRLLFGLFWVILICLLAAALVTIVQTPECKTPPKLEWWQKGPMYRVVLKSNRGIRDPKGILRQLQYIVQLNVVAIILVPNEKLNQTSRTPNDSSSFQYIMDYIYDLKPFLKAASKHGIKVVLDFTPFYAPLGNDIWTSIDQDEDFLSTLLTEFHFGFREGVDGIFLKISALNSKKKFMRELLKTWKEIASKYSSSSKKRIFIIGTNMEKYDYFASVLVNVHGVIIFVYYLSAVLKTSKITEIALILNDYYQIVQNEWSGFSGTASNHRYKTEETIGFNIQKNLAGPDPAQ
ncbi:amino acid transporter heavy chain SLC3A2-like isoform X2 [Narcine bancroftii]|uniref:amino acid transporter heavy chain SLC3A2-like isoform X2 n=1 Tax=Narcine bancroftii TaxID=1343680 RepID=UPI0038310227